MAILEVCAGSVADCVAAHKNGSPRVELCGALNLGGTTPTTSALLMVKDRCPGLSIMSMVRPRGAGFCYTDLEYEQMLIEAKDLVSHGSDGIVFGILREDRSFDVDRMKALVSIALEAGKTAVCHRAFDCVDDQDKAMELLIEIGVDRVLTSGGAPDAGQGIEQLAHLNKTYGNKIQIMPGAGVSIDNAKKIIDATGVTQVHSSCGGWFKDPTTSGPKVSYAYHPDHPMEYDGSIPEKIKALVEAIQ